MPRLFDIAFHYQGERSARLPSLGAAQVLAVDTFSGFTPFDLTLSVKADPKGGLVCHFEYATELFEHETVQRFAPDYASVLATLAFNAHAYVGEVRVSASHEPAQAGADYTGLAVSDA